MPFIVLATLVFFFFIGGASAGMMETETSIMSPLFGISQVLSGWNRLTRSTISNCPSQCWWSRDSVWYVAPYDEWDD